MKSMIQSLLVFLMSVALSSTAWAQANSISSSSETDTTPLHDPQVDYPGSTEKPLTRALIAQLYALNKDGQIYQAWKILADQDDGYAQSATRIFGGGISVEKCVVESNWKLVVSAETKERYFEDYAQLYQKHYIEHLDKNLRYPNSLEIEKLYQRTDDEFGLPQSVSVDLMMNLVPEEWGRRIFFDELSSSLGIGRHARPKRWFHYTKLSEARAVPEFITAQNINVDQAKALYRKAAGLIAKCMAKKLKPKPQAEKSAE